MEFNTALILIALWTLPWKGVALWKAAHRDEKKWFVALLILNTLAILEIIYIFYFSKLPQKSSKSIAPLSGSETFPDSPEREAYKKKILEAAHEWKKITHDTVTRLLNVDAQTAALYLEELLGEGKIVTAKSDGDNAVYRLKK